ncbi:hypothetical protein M427DRAFT_497136 [Gonapodya prolifera JEL478]|uniref:Threonine/serine exporter-like N-terminal domain-containing protein n=1 Tax=Gonapodya prolifera (strain JEL478) TaxID=1344416 RepID=A0A139AFI7_GONPJ|nr:hypothetical protein M427DRAFT_497136 [Gonapodya prolifera JEL478]|eukprot:KXS15566.1 hypothetical protein M427DRAFT_497136 [Gonapodya prolifera JEL478]
MSSSNAESLNGDRDDIVTSPLLSVRQSRPANLSNVSAELTNHKKRDILIRLTKALIPYVSPTYRLEKYMKSVAAALDLERAQFVILHQTLFTGFPVAVPIMGDSSTEIESTSFSPLLEEWNMEKLGSVIELINDLKNGDVSQDSAEGHLNVIDGCRSTFPSTLSNLIAFPLQAGVSSVFLFGGNLLTFALTVVVGLFTGVIQCLPSLANLRLQKNNERPLTFLASSDLSVLQRFLAAVSSFVARILSYKFATDQFLFLLSGVFVIVPGALGLQGVLSLWKDAPGNGSQITNSGEFAAQVVKVTIGILAGIVLSHLIVFAPSPRGRRKSVVRFRHISEAYVFLALIGDLYLVCTCCRKYG